MAAQLDLGQEDGVLEVRFGDTTVSIDTIDVWDQFVEHEREHRHSPRFAATLPDFVRSLGLPAMSQRVAVRFFSRLAEEVEKLRGEDGIRFPGPPEIPDLPLPPARKTPDVRDVPAVAAMPTLQELDDATSALEQIREAIERAS